MLEIFEKSTTERARDYLKKIHGWEVIEGIMSPVADSLGRPDMVPAKHRLKMVELAVKSSSWIRYATFIHHLQM